MLNPKWVRCFQLPSETSRKHRLKVTIYDRDSRTQDFDKQEVIGYCECIVEDILEKKNSGMTMELENLLLKQSGMITIIGELHGPDSRNHEIFLGECKFRNTSIFGMLLTRPYITIYRQRPNNEWSPIFRSQAKRRGEDAAIAEDLLHRAIIRTSAPGGNPVETPLRIELRSHRNMAEHKLIGAVQMSLASLRRQGTGKKISLGLAGESIGELYITRATLAENSSSFDFEVSFSSN